MYKSMYGLQLKGVNACISLILESVLIFSEAKGLKQPPAYSGQEMLTPM